MSNVRSYIVGGSGTPEDPWIIGSSDDDELQFTGSGTRDDPWVQVDNPPRRTRNPNTEDMQFTGSGTRENPWVEVERPSRAELWKAVTQAYYDPVYDTWRRRRQ